MKLSDRRRTTDGPAYPALQRRRFRRPVEAIHPHILPGNRVLALAADRTTIDQVIEILVNLPSHMGYIIIEHDMDVALRVAESVTMMHNGAIFKEGRPEEIEEDPEVQELYLGGGHG